MKSKPKKIAFSILIAVVAMASFQYLNNSANQNFVGDADMLPELSKQDKNQIAALNRRFGVLQMTSISSGRVIAKAESSRLMADIFHSETEAPAIKAELLMETRSGDILLLQSEQNAAGEMIDAYGDLSAVKAVERNQDGELFDTLFSNNNKTSLSQDSSAQTVAAAGASGKNKMIIAVIDSGIDGTHPALRDSVWKNPKELMGKSGVDDDGNGKIDDVNGWNFVTNSADVSDVVGHGTHISGVISAKPTRLNSMKGINPDGVQIIPLKVADGKSGLKLSNVLAALQYAADNNAKVINMSLGFPDESAIFHSAVKKLKQNGVYLIAAAGNFADSAKQYPAAFEEVLSVGSANLEGGRWKTSNFGEWVDIHVPGKLLSTLPNSMYGTKSGTSQSAALITGMYSFIKSTIPTGDDKAIEKSLNVFAKQFAGDAFLASLTTGSSAAQDWIGKVSALLKQGKFPTPVEEKNYNLKKTLTKDEAAAFLLAYLGNGAAVTDALRTFRAPVTPLTVSPDDLLGKYLHPAAAETMPSTKPKFLSEPEMIELLVQLEKNINTKVKNDSPLQPYFQDKAPYVSREKFVDIVFQAFSK